MKGSDGKYHINGMVFEILIGSRAQVNHGTAYKTSGGLKKKDLKKNKHGKIVSRKKSAKGPQMLKRLTRKGYHTRKGHFGWVKGKGKGHGSKHTRKHRRKHRKGSGLHHIKGVDWEDRGPHGHFAHRPGYHKKKRGGSRSRRR